MEYDDSREDLEYEELKAIMADGESDAWVTVPTRTISKYLSIKILEELSEIDEINKNPSSGELQQILDQRIVRLADSIRG